MQIKNLTKKNLGMVVEDIRQAHHIIPLNLQGNRAIQKAAKAFHINDFINGIPLSSAVHNGSRAHYDDLVKGYLDAIPANARPSQTYQKVVDIVNDISRLQF